MTQNLSATGQISFEGFEPLAETQLRLARGRRVQAPQAGTDKLFLALSPDSSAAAACAHLARWALPCSGSI